MNAFKITFFAVLFFMTTEAYTQPSFESLEDRFMRAVDTYRTTPQNLTEGDIKKLIKDIETYISGGGLEAIERFTLPYYSGYLYYILGLSQDDLVALDTARQKFAVAVGAHNKDVHIDKKVFSEFMQAWCYLRIYLMSPVPDNLEAMGSARTILENLAAQPEARFIRNDVHFMKGFINYFLVKDKYKHLEFASEDLDQAIADFDKAGEGESDLNKLSRFYAAAARVLRSKYSALSLVLSGQTGQHASGGSRTDADSALTLLNQLPEFGDVSRLGYYLAFLQNGVADSFVVNSGQLLFNPLDTSFDGITPTLTPLLREYARFLNYLSLGRDTGVAPGAGNQNERNFWIGLKQYLLFLSGGDAQAPNDGLFANAGTSDWRDQYLAALAGFFRKEASILSGNFQNVKVESDDLMPYYKTRNRYLNDLIRLRTTFFNANTTYDITSLASVMEMVQFELEEVLMPYAREVLPASSDQEREEVYGFANHVLTLAATSRRLYPAAYLVYEYLNQLGFKREKMALLRAYCIYKYVGNSEEANRPALDLLSDAAIANYSPSNKYEAYYYRAMLYRKIDGLEYSPRVVPEMQMAQEHHPYAGYGIGYEQNGKVTPEYTSLMNRVYTQACNDAELTGLCEACKRIQGWAPQPVLKPPAIHIGEPDVRFVSLEQRLQNFVRREKKFLLNWWMAFSVPLLKPMPGIDQQQACDFRGPMEYYLGNKITINLSLGQPEATKHVTISGSSDGCRPFELTKSDTTVQVLALRSYRIVSASKGYYPTIIDTTFKSEEDVLTLVYDEALKVRSGNAVPQRPEEFELRVDAEKGYYVASKGGEPCLRIYGGSGKPLSDANISYSAITSAGDRVFILNRVSGQLIELSSDGQLRNPDLENFDEKQLNRPADLAGDRHSLFIANSGDNTIVKYHFASQEMEKSPPVSDGQIEKIAVIGGRLWVTDWKGNRILTGNPSLVSNGFTDLMSADKARADGMIAPSTISMFGTNYVLISDALANKLFLFHKTGEYLNALEVTGVATPRLASVKTTGNNAKLTVYHSLGVSEFDLERDNSFEFVPTCTTARVGLQLAADDASRFCSMTFD